MQGTSIHHVVSWQLSLSIQKQNQGLSDESKQNRPCGISTTNYRARGAKNLLLIDECVLCECACASTASLPSCSAQLQPTVAKSSA